MAKDQKLRVVVLVSSDMSDIYFANQLMKKLNVAGIIVENQNEYSNVTLFAKGLKYLKNPKLISEKIKEEVYGKRFRELAYRVNYKGFGEEGLELNPSTGAKVIYTEGVRAINSSIYVEKIKSLKPDIIAVCGTSILKKEILAIPSKGVINLHGGLSQWYRGVWATLWAVYNGEPEYVGATVHYVSDGIDDGNIIYQGRPEISADDNQESLYVKVVKLGIDLMIKSINEIGSGVVRSYPLRHKGRLYLSKQVTHEVVRDTWKRVEAGVIRDYIRGQKARKRIDIYE